MRDLLHDWTSGEQIDSAELMVSEMLTNVLVHTDNDALLLAEAVGEQGNRRIAGRGRGHQRRSAAPQTAGGAGVQRAWAGADGDAGGRVGVDPRGDGKSIWFELYECGNEALEAAAEGKAGVSGTYEAGP